MLFECFYYPILSNNKIIKSCDKLNEFNFGDKLPVKTLYYNYGENFIIYQGDEFFRVKDSILLDTVNPTEINFPINIIFNKGTQLTINSLKDLNSIRLILNGEFEEEKNFGSLFFLYNNLVYKIKHTQYDILSLLTNSSRDYIFINDELDLNTQNLLIALHTVRDKICNLLEENKKLITQYIKYMNFNDDDNLTNLSIYKYFPKDTEEHNEFSIQTSKCKNKKSHPKDKLYKLIKCCNLDSSILD